MKRLISFIIKAEKGFLKKPDINDGIYLTYNMLHKPALLGILGAITGLKGYQENGVFPDYYNKLKNIPVGIKPVGDEKGNFQKTKITYNNTTGLASNEQGGNLMITEQTLIKPSYKVYLLLDLESENENKLYQNIKGQKAEYLPYLGKNDYSLWWDKEEVEEYVWDKTEVIKHPFNISSVFIKETTVKDSIDNDTQNFDLFDFSVLSEEKQFVSFERLPINFNEKLFQYNYKDFAYTNFTLKAGLKLSNIFKLENGDYIQLN
jgi:CRISPR-associated protein Cas5h